MVYVRESDLSAINHVDTHLKHVRVRVIKLHDMYFSSFVCMMVLCSTCTSASGE